MIKSTNKNAKNGYMLLILVFVIFSISIGLLVAVPLWQTQVKREMEEELIFRGNQFVEAVRLFQTKNPGTFPKNFEELIEEKCLRRLYRDPMTANGEWNIIMPIQGGPTRPARPGRRRRSSDPSESGRNEAGGTQKVLIAPFSVLPYIKNPQIIGVVSTSTASSIKIYKGQTSYDRWLFFYGQEGNKLPEIVIYGQEEETE